MSSDKVIIISSSVCMRRRRGLATVDDDHKETLDCNLSITKDHNNNVESKCLCFHNLHDPIGSIWLEPCPLNNYGRVEAKKKVSTKFHESRKIFHLMSGKKSRSIYEQRNTIKMMRRFVRWWRWRWKQRMNINTNDILFMSHSGLLRYRASKHKTFEFRLTQKRNERLGDF